MTSNDVWRDLADLIVKRRRQLGINTQPEFADAADVSLSTIGRLESGRPMSRRSRLWGKIERALKFEEGFIEQYVTTHAERSGYLIQASELTQIEPRARAAIKDALMATLPDATVSQIIAAEAAAIKALRDRGLLPPEE